MSKLILNDIGSLQNETSVVNNINQNNDRIESALENTLSRDGSTPNAMSSTLDMNSQTIINLPEPTTNTEPATKAYADAIATAAEGFADAAEASATAAASSASSASTSASNASTSASSASTSASNASTSATNAATSATNAASSATAAAASAELAANNVISLLIFDATTSVSTGDAAGGIFWRIPSSLNGYNLTGVAAAVRTAGTTNTTDIQISRKRSGSSVDMLSTKITIDSTELDSSTAATPAVINGSNDDVATADQITIDVDAVHTTPPAGLIVELTFHA